MTGILGKSQLINNSHAGRESVSLESADFHFPSHVKPGAADVLVTRNKV